MGWRCVVVESQCKISCSGNYLIVRNEDVKKIHLSEICYLMIASTNVSLTGVALCELAKQNIKVVFCDEKHNPYGEIMPYYGNHNCSKRIKKQVGWQSDLKDEINLLIIKRKILNQAKLLYKLSFDDRAKMLEEYADSVIKNDETNREGHSAKVYFNTLFGQEFSRQIDSNVNSGLNYGYTVLLSCINREVVANGCLTQLGMQHCNEFNEFNFSCDLIEPFRIIVDEYVYLNKDRVFDSDYKHDLVNILNKKVNLGCERYLHNAIAVSVKSVIDSLDENDVSLLKLYEFE